MKYKTKLIMGFSALLFTMILLLGIILHLLTTINEGINEIVTERYIKLKLANDIQNNVNTTSRLIATLLINESDQDIKQDIADINESISSALMKLTQLQGKVENVRAKQLTIQISGELRSYDQRKKDVFSLLEKNQKEQAVRMVTRDMAELKNDLFASIEELKNIQESLMDEAYMRSIRQYQFVRNTAMIFLFVGLGIGVFVTIWVVIGMGKNLRQISSIISTVTTEHPDSLHSLPRIHIDTHDEIGEIGRAFNRMAETLENHAIQEEEYLHALQEHSWLKTQIAEITSFLQGVQDVQTLAQVLVSKITPLVHASYGILAVRDGQTEAPRFLIAGTYAAKHEKMDHVYVEVGQGLIGQCALENKMIYVHDIPDDYIEIFSGAGKAKPNTLILLPIAFEGHVLAVLELASFGEISQLHEDLLIEITQDVGSLINSIYKHMQVRALLVESQLLTEELQSQSEELQLQQEELRSINEKLEDQYRNAEIKTRELEKVKEELERHTIEIQQASQFKSEFLANMSHEFRTPLNSLLILAQILAENKEGNLTPKQVEFASTIYTSGSNLLALINDILDLTKVESGKMDIHYAEVQLASITEFIERSFQPIANRKNLTFIIEVSKNVPDVIWTDEQRVEQILTNLLSNAFKFTQEGRVTLRISHTQEKGMEEIHFTVEDTGTGIPEDKLELIFEAFKQADGTTSRNYGGTGLGLSISRELAYLLGGSIHVHSKEHKGSSFTFCLPLHHHFYEQQGEYHLPPVAVTIAEETQHGVTEVLSGRSILIVDDDMRNIFALTSLLEEQDMIVHFAENGREGIAVLLEHPEIDIVLMDIMMPEMDGFQAITQIRQLPGKETLPIIALTAKAMKQDREKCIEVGASDYISKPVNLDQLFSLIRVWLYR